MVKNLLASKVLRWGTAGKADKRFSRDTGKISGSPRATEIQAVLYSPTEHERFFRAGVVVCCSFAQKQLMCCVPSTYQALQRFADALHFAMFSLALLRWISEIPFPKRNSN